MPPSVVTTRRLTLRPLTDGDLRHPDVERWHLDPEGYREMHEEPYTDAVQFRSTAMAWVTAWAEGGPSYWLAIDRAIGDPVGLGGVRRLVVEGVDHLNLYYRLGPAARGRGLGREIATAAVVHAREWCPDLPVVARVAGGNDHSLAVARASGLRDLGPRPAPGDPAGQPTPVLLTAPVALTGPPPDAAAYDALVTLWSAVNAAGGAVGFPGAVPRAEVEAVLDRHLAQVENGRTALIRIAEPTPQTREDPTAHGRLLGFGFAHRYSGPAAHRANLERVMVDPGEQRRGLGRVLLADLHAWARRTDLEIATITYRGGTGLESFYDAAGYAETGRLPGGLRVGDRDVDDVQMAYWLDGKGLPGRAQCPGRSVPEASA